MRSGRVRRVLANAVCLGSAAFLLFPTLSQAQTREEWAAWNRQKREKLAGHRNLVANGLHHESVTQPTSIFNPLSLLSINRFPDFSGDTVVVGEVQNITTSTLTFARVTISLFGNGGTPLGSEDTYTEDPGNVRLSSSGIQTSALAPGAIGFFKMYTDIPFNQVVSHTFISEAETYAVQNVLGNVTLLGSVALTPSSIGGPDLNGTVRSSSAQALTYFTRVALVGYQSGQISDVTSWYVDGISVPCNSITTETGVAPNGSAPFDGFFSRSVSTIQRVAINWDEKAITPASQAFPANGGGGAVSVQSNCNWTAASNAGWLTVIAGAGGTSDGTVSFTVAQNTSAAPRTGTIMIAGIPFTATQAGAGISCSYAVSPSNTSVGPASSTGSLTVTTNPTTGCSWTAASAQGFLAITSGLSGSGTGMISYAVSANGLPSPRTASITVTPVNGTPLQFNLTQAAAPTDADNDGLPDTFETQFGLSPNSGTGDNGPSGDPDADGRTNAQELAAGTHPRGFFTRYLAEGATSSFFDTNFAVVNPSPATASLVLLRFLKRDGSTANHFENLVPRRRTTVIAKEVAGLNDAEFSTVVESDTPVVVDRTMTWDAGGYGSHAETSLASPANTWYLAEGATHSSFDLFYLIQNANTAPATVMVTYLLPAPAPPIVKNYTVNANSRFNIWVDQEAGLQNTDVSAQIVSNIPIIVERAMYLNSGGLSFGAGHESAGVTSTATNWFLAEGATGSFFDLFLLIANPTAEDAQIAATYLLAAGAVVTREYTVAAHSRYNVWVDIDPELADEAVSVKLVSTNGVGILVERSMWWPGTSASWNEAHNSPGATATGTRWALAEGEIGGTRNTQTYLLIANTSGFAGAATVTLLFEDGSTTAKVFALAPNSRFNVNVGAELPVASGRKFGAIVESTALAAGFSLAQLVVERAMYSDSAGVTWAAGTNALATRLEP